MQFAKIVASGREWRIAWSILRSRIAQSGLVYPVCLFASLRVLYLAWATLSTRLMPVSVFDKIALYHETQPMVSGLDGLLWGPWQRWDTLWYAKIAEKGYSSGDLSTAFFPLYPLLMRLVAPLLGHNTIAAGVLISSVAALASLTLLYRMTTNRFGESVARRTLLFLVAFPTAFFLFAAYTESLFLGLVLGSLWSAQSRRWGLACVLGALAALTRPQGALFILVLAVEFFLQYLRDLVPLARGAFLGITALGVGAYPLYLSWEFRDPLLWFHVQHWWHRAAMPWDSIGASLAVAFSAKNWYDVYYSLRDPAAELLFVALMLLSIRRLSPTFSVYMAIVLLPPLMSISTYQPLLPLASMWRYVLVAFPGFILLSQILLLKRWQSPVVLASFAFQMVVFTRFLQWILVG